MSAPRMSAKVEEGLWLIVARSATVMEAEAEGASMDRDEREKILAAVKYAEWHWGRTYGREVGE